MGSVLGSAEVLTSLGWIGRLTGNFIVMMIFLAIIYLGARLSGTRIAGLSAAILTIGTATVFFLADKFTYTQYFQGILGSLLPYPNIQPLSFFPGLPIIETSPGWYAALTLLLFVVGTVCYFVWESKGSGHYRPFSAAFLGVAVTMLSFFALLFGVASMLGQNVSVSGELMIPFIPFVSWWWPLAIVYLVLGIGLWVAFKGAWWLYLIIQIAGLVV
ncbi:MAG: hypothetical protein ABSD49_14045 [Candidatus Bathyarchaeia archaeon]|jgi:hypothetical protein